MQSWDDKLISVFAAVEVQLLELKAPSNLGTETLAIVMVCRITDVIHADKEMFIQLKCVITRIKSPNSLKTDSKPKKKSGTPEVCYGTNSWKSSVFCSKELVPAHAFSIETEV